MKIEQRTYKDFRELEERPTNKRGKKISLILPARDEHKTIGNYFPTIANLMNLGCIDEIIIADSSDDNRTIDAAMESAMNTHPFSDLIYSASKNGQKFPIKAVNVFDSRFTTTFNGHKPKLGEVPGKGRAMYLGIAVASGDILLFLDTDFYNIDPRFVYGLAGPFEDSRTILSKATFELEDTYYEVIDTCRKNGEEVASCDLLLKSVNARTIAKPMMKIIDDELGLFPGISDFNGPLSGGCGAPKEVWQSLIIPTHYGIEVSYLMQFVDKFPNGHYAYDVNLGEVVQDSQDAEGSVRMAKNIISTVLHHIRSQSPELYATFASNPSQFANIYLRHAADCAVHFTDVERMNLYANIMQDMLNDGSVMNTPILPALNQNPHYVGSEEQVIHFANQATAESIKRINSNSVGRKTYRSEPNNEAIIPTSIAFT